MLLAVRRFAKKDSWLVSHNLAQFCINWTYIHVNVPDCVVAACADAYLTPCIKRYLSSFSAGFTNLQVQVICIV